MAPTVTRALALGLAVCALEAAPAHGWKSEQVLPVVSQRKAPPEPSALVLDSLDDVRWLIRRAPELCSTVRAVVAPHNPSGSFPVLAGLGILALCGSSDAIAALKSHGSLRVPDPREWNGGRKLTTTAGSSSVDLEWLAVGAERDWTASGSARPAPLTNKR